ncbi:MAG: hypothetical protein AB7O56_09550 [Bauldia sp.]
MLFTPPVAWRIVPPATLTFIGSDSATGSSAPSFGSFAIPDSGLMIAAVVGTRNTTNNVTLNSISLGGSAGTIAVARSGVSGNEFGGIAYRQVSAGSRSVSASFNLTMDNPRCFVWLLTANASDTPVAVDMQIGSGSDGRSATLDGLSGGVAVYAALWRSSSANIAFTGATERAEITETTGRCAGGDKAFPASVIGDVVSVAGGSGTVLTLGASWR